MLKLIEFGLVIYFTLTSYKNIKIIKKYSHNKSSNFILCNKYIVAYIDLLKPQFFSLKLVK